MSAYQNEAPLTIASLTCIELSIFTEELGIESDDTHHLIGAEFFYCGLLVDGKILVTEHELNILLPLLDRQVHHVSGMTLFLNTRKEPGTSNSMVRQIHTQNFMDEVEDEEMIFALKECIDEAWAGSAIEQ